jgi:predicted esterase
MKSVPPAQLHGVYPNLVSSGRGSGVEDKTMIDAYQSYSIHVEPARDRPDAAHVIRRRAPAVIGKHGKILAGQPPMLCNAIVMRTLALLVGLLLAPGCDGEQSGDADVVPDGDAALDDPLALVPPEALEAEPSADCPGEYAARSPAAGQNQRFGVAEQARSFWLEVPDGRAHPGPRPLLVAFGGTGENGEDFIERARLESFVERGFLVVAPDSAQNGTVWRQWDGMRTRDDQARPNADLAFFDALVRCVAAHYEVDRNRVYVAGHSAGGAMADAVLQRRSELLAGGVIASGAFRMTSPPGSEDLDETLALITWGGEADESPDAPPGLDLVDEASVASQFYDRQPRVGQVNCAAEVGHVWLAQLNEFMVELLLDHPRGLPGAGATMTLPPLPEGASARCSTEPFLYESGLECPESSTAGCREVCDFFSDCLVELEGLGSLLAALGFGDDLDDCGGCVSRCEELATAAADVEVLGCLAEADRTALCPVVDGINECCASRDDSPYCLALCAVIDDFDLTDRFFPTCDELLGPPPCTADGVCDPACSPASDPDCLAACMVPDGACDAECPSGTDPDCAPDCGADGVCALLCPAMTDPDCPATCAADGACNFVCGADDDPDCSSDCGVVDGPCCDDGPRCLPDLLCVEAAGGPRCATACAMPACDYGGEVGVCQDTLGVDFGLCMPPDRLPALSECVPPSVHFETCTTEYGQTEDTTCLEAPPFGNFCLAFCDLVDTGCDGDHSCTAFPEGDGCAPVP